MVAAVLEPVLGQAAGRLQAGVAGQGVAASGQVLVWRRPSLRCFRCSAAVRPGTRWPASLSGRATPGPIRVGRRCSLGGARVVVGYGTVLRSALDGAVRDGLLARNPAAQVRRPGVERQEARHVDAEAVTAALKAAEESPLSHRAGVDRLDGATQG